MPSKLLNFRCPAEVLEAIHQLGRELYPAENSNGCDQSKTVLEIMRAGIEALSDGSIVLQTPEVKQVKQPSDIRPILSDTELDERITQIVESKTEALRTALRDEILGESAA
ncbi:hypothetical protein QUA54_31515 [Microcoleus sp. MOSTC5]|uniref:hypothetical protein n=1 Tax=Microcoleus sp. MOSTC5 TaxID=3055378 RepID=UPI002FD02868